MRLREGTHKYYRQRNKEASYAVHWFLLSLVNKLRGQATGEHGLAGIMLFQGLGKA